MPIVVNYGPVTALGQMAVNAGEGEDFLRRHAMGQQLVQDQRQYNLQSAALQQQAAQGTLSAAYANRPGTNATNIGPGAQSVTPETLRLQESLASINEAFKRGTIDQESRDRMEIAARTGSPSLGSIGVTTDPDQISASQQRLRSNDMVDRQIQALKIAEDMAKSKANQFLDAVGGAAVMNDEERKQYQALTNDVLAAQGERKKLLSGAGSVAGQSGGGGGVTRTGRAKRNPSTGQTAYEMSDGTWSIE